MFNVYSSIGPRSPEGGQPVKRGKLPIAFLLGFSMLINVNST